MQTPVCMHQKGVNWIFETIWPLNQLNFFIFKTREVSLSLIQSFDRWLTQFRLVFVYILLLHVKFFVYCIWTKWEEIETFPFNTQRVKYNKSCEIVVGQKFIFDFIFFWALMWIKDIHTFIQNGPTSTRQMTMHWNLRGRCLTFSRAILVFFSFFAFFSFHVESCLFIVGINW